MSGEVVRQDNRSLPRWRAIVLLRYTLIIAAAYMVLAEERFKLPDPGVALLIVFAFISNAALPFLPRRILDAAFFDVAVILTDTAWTTLILYRTGHFGSEFFYLFFFILLLAATGERLALIGLSAVVISVAYLYLQTRTGMAALWTSPSLIRIPFLFSVAISYGYLVDRARQERQRASEADRIKAEFLGTVSHEMRTPLNIIVGYVDLLLDHSFGELSDQEEEVLRQLRRSAYNLYGFMTHLLDVSRLVNRLRSGHDEITCSQVCFDAIIGELQREFPAGLTSTVEWRQEETPPLWTDEMKVQIILRNLVENAVKYGRGGAVTVSSEWRQADDMLEVRVADTGVGIAEEDLPHIFNAFHRATSQRCQDIPGVGLGLYVVKELVELLGGRIEVSSKVNVGSTFIVRLPRVFTGNGSAPSGVAELSLQTHAIH